MIHEGSSMQAGKSSDLKAAHKYNSHLESMANSILGEKTIKDKKFWSEQTKTDLYLSAKDAQKFGKKKYKEKYEMEMNKAAQAGKDPHDDNFYERKAEKYGRKMAKDYLRINRKNIYK